MNRRGPKVGRGTPRFGYQSVGKPAAVGGGKGQTARGLRAASTYVGGNGPSRVVGVKVTEIMSRPVITVRQGTTIKEAARILVARGISALPVLDGKGGLAGIVSEADLLPTQTRPDPRSQATPIPPTAGSSPQRVADVMTRRVLVVPDDAEVSQAARMMLDADVKRVPVMSGRRLVGIVSRRDLIKVIARQDEDLQGLIVKRLAETGLLGSKDVVSVHDGVATLQLDGATRDRRLAESIALAVPGVLEVRFQPSRRRSS